MSGYKYAFGLSKQEVRDAEPPGTSRLIRHDQRETKSSGTGVDSLTLVPQPSNDPADPLNWSAGRKAGVIWVVCLYAFTSNFTSSSISSALPVLDEIFHPPQTFASLTHVVAINVLMLGASNVWWVPLGNVYGRRSVLLVATLLMTLSTMWCGLAKSFGSLLAARFFQGCGAGASETLAPDIVGEILFVHQRGRGLAVYTVFLALGPLVGGTVGGYILANLGYAYIHWIGVALSAACFVSAFFLLPETLFDRQRRMTQDVAPNAIHEPRPVDSKGGDVYVERISSPPPFTFARSLRIGTNRGGLVRQFARPWLTIRLPGVWVVMLQYAGLVAGIVTISTVGPELVSLPPYLWGKNAGLINIGGIIGTILGAIYTAVMADSLLKRQAKHEVHGLAEPEARLPALLPSLFLAATGLWVFGFCAANPAPGRWVGLQVGYGMLTFGLMQVPSINFTYIIDAYNAVSSDCLMIVTLFRAIISFAWIFFVGTWIGERGPSEPFGIFGMLMFIFGLLTIPLWLYGKRSRIATAKWMPMHADH